VYYIGSPYQVDWGEAGDEKRFLVWENGVMSSVPVEGAPRFRRVAAAQWKKLSEEDRKRDFFEIEVKNLDQARELELPDNAIPVSPAKKATTTDTTVELQSFSVGSAVEAYLTEVGRPDLVNKALSRLTA
jgi:DNA repair exonuclease SbcCD nuclease subunit